MQNFYYLCSGICPKCPQMDQKRIYHLIEWVVALAACGYLIYRMAIYDEYATLWATLRDMSWPQIAALVLCVVLMPVNMGLEAWRWHSLMNEGVKELKNEGISWSEAHRQVYYSKLAGLITPWRLGEYPARGVLMKSQESRVKSQESIWARVLSMGAVGSATMTAAIVLAGLVSLVVLVFLDQLVQLGLAYYLLVSAVLILLILVLVFAPRLLRRWAEVSHRLILISTAQSFVRLACWCVQLALVLYALGAMYNVQCTMYNVPIYYLLVTITPNVPIAEVGVRGAWAIMVFGSMNAALAGVLLWGINTLLPCLIWPFLRKKEK